MMPDRARTYKWLLVSIAITAIGTLLLWRIFGPRAFFGFLFLPFFPILFGRGEKEERVPLRCPRCGHVAEDPDDRYCPRDAAPLV